MSEIPSLPPPPPPAAGSRRAPADAAPTGAAPADAAPAASLPARVTGLSCPSCGGALEVDAGVRVVVCPFCSTPLLATSELGLRRFAVAAETDLEQARTAVRRWLASGWNKDRRLPASAEMAEGYLTFLPFFRLQSDVVGVALGTEERRRTTGSGKSRRTETYEVDVERWVERHYDETYAAVNVAELGVWRVDLAGDHLVPYDDEDLARRGMVFPPTRSEPEVRRTALAGFKEAADPGRGMKRVRFRFLETVREAFTVVYYPLWVVRYRFEGRSYVSVVDAQDGSLAYGKAPGNDLYRAVMMIATEAAVCFALTSVFYWADECGPVAGVLLAGMAALAWAWRRFRYGGVVEEGSGLPKDRDDGAQRFKRFLKEGPRSLTR